MPSLACPPWRALPGTPSLARPPWRVLPGAPSLARPPWLALPGAPSLAAAPAPTCAQPPLPAGLRDARAAVQDGPAAAVVREDCGSAAQRVALPAHRQLAGLGGTTSSPPHLLTLLSLHLLTSSPPQALPSPGERAVLEVEGCAAAGESDLASKLSRDYQEKQVYLLTPLLFCVFTLRNCIFCD